MSSSAETQTSPERGSSEATSSDFPPEPAGNLSWLDLGERDGAETPEETSEVEENDRRVQGAVDALHADWLRQENSLERSQFDRIVLKRKLDAEEIVDVLRRLKALGVVPESLDDEPDEELFQDGMPVGTREGMVSEFVAGFSKAPILKHDEHVFLSRTVQLGMIAQRDRELGAENAELDDLIARGRAARDKMVIANVRLVFSLAHKVGRGGLEFTDHVQNGTIGLMRAVELFDPDVGVRFSTYATWWIRQSIWRGLDTESELIRLPVYQRENVRKLRRMTRRLAAEMGRDPRPSELGEALGWPLDRVAFVQRVTLFRSTSLELPIDEEGDLLFGDLLPGEEPSPEQVTTIISRNRLLMSLVATLSEREQMILDRRFGFTSGYTETLQQIGDDAKVTRERIRQIQDKALKKLYRKALRHIKALTDR